MNDELPQEYRVNGFLIALVIVGCFTVGMAVLFRAAMAPAVSPLSGKEFPPIEAAMWVNGDAPTAESLRGKVLLVDAWAYWCGPCRQTTPYLIELHNKFKDQDVVFIGLTSEGRDSRTIRESQKYITSLKIPWLNGLAAVKPLSALDVSTIPQLWIVDRQNRIVHHEVGFTSNSVHELGEAITKALQTTQATPDSKR